MEILQIDHVMMEHYNPTINYNVFFLILIEILNEIKNDLKRMILRNAINLESQLQ